MTDYTTVYAHELTKLAWADCDALGEFRDWARWSGRIEDQRTIAANLIDLAELAYEDQTGEQVTLAAMILAREMLILEADECLEREADERSAEEAEPRQMEMRYFGSA